MARINIEDQFWLDVVKVAISMGDQDKAIGTAVRWFRFAQQKHKDGEVVSEDEFIDEGFPESLIPAFAKRVDGGIIVRGAEKHFGWLDKKREAGTQGAKKTNEKRWTGKRRQKSADVSTSQHSSPSSSSSSSISSSFSISHSPSSSLKNKSSDGPEGATGSDVWNAYRDAFVSRYKTEPVRNKTVNSQIKNLVGRLGTEAVDVVKFYLSHNDAFYVRKHHPIGLCLTDAEGLRAQWATGRKVTGNTARQAEKSDHYQSQMERVERGEL